MTAKQPRKFKVAVNQPEISAPRFWLRGPTNRLRIVNDLRKAGKYQTCMVGAVVNTVRRITSDYVITVL